MSPYESDFKTEKVAVKIFENELRGQKYDNKKLQNYKIVESIAFSSAVAS